MTQVLPHPCVIVMLNDRLLPRIVHGRYPGQAVTTTVTMHYAWQQSAQCVARSDCIARCSVCLQCACSLCALPESWSSVPHMPPLGVTQLSSHFNETAAARCPVAG